jgi:Domain of unknown function (DUF4397)
LNLRQRAAAALLAPACALLLLACAEGTTDPDKAQLRFVNASAVFGDLALQLNNQLSQGQVAYGGNSSYVQANTGSTTGNISPANGTTVLTSFSTDLAKGKYSTVLAYGTGNAPKVLVLDDNTAEPADNKSLVRVINAAPDAGSLDVYLTGASEDLAAATPLQADATLGAVGAWVTRDSAAGTSAQRLRIVGKGSKTDLRLDVSGITLASRQLLTVVLTPALLPQAANDSRAAVLTQALLLTQRGGVARLDNTGARVRVVAGISGGAAVQASVAGSSVLPATQAPAVGSYVLVPAGSNQTVVLSVAGSNRNSTQTLLAGADYTLLLHGSPAAPQSSWLADNNALPSDSTQARLRLVNGTTGATGALALTADLAPVGTSTLAGADSGYTSLAASTTVNLAVRAAGTPAPLFSATGQTLQAGATYSVIVLGAANAPNVPDALLRRDR